jgi:4-hydroxybenzoate polyprenyltransferase
MLGYVPPLCSPLHLFIVGNTLCIYSLHYYIKKTPTTFSDRAQWTAQYKYIHLILLGIGIVMAGASMWYLPFSVIITSVALGLLSVAYSLPLLPIPQKRRLKDWGLVKLMLLSMVWTAVTVIMPMLYHQKSFQAYEVEFLLRWTFLFVLCIAFDIRDMQTDKANSIHTLPNIIGIKQAYHIMDIGLVVMLILTLIQYLRYPIIERLWSGFLIVVLCKYALVQSKRINTDWYYLLCIDGLMLVYAILVLIL